MRHRYENDKEKMKSKFFICPREAFLEFADELLEEFLPNEYQRLSIPKIKIFIERFLEMHFPFDP